MRIVGRPVGSAGSRATGRGILLVGSCVAFGWSQLCFLEIHRSICSIART